MYVNSIISYHFYAIILRCVYPHNSAVFHAKGYAAELPPEASGHRFSYRSIRPVYTIVLIEQSTAIFSKFPDTYIHRFSQMSDSGLSMNLLHHYIFIPLDIFKKTHQNGDAWLMFLSTDEPNKIMRLVD